MILLYALLLGLLAAIVRSLLSGSSLEVPDLQHPWLVFVGFLPQLFAFVIPVTRERIPAPGASWALIFSQFILLIFVWMNRTLPGFWILGTGLALNLGVIISNGGWMPIQPSTVRALAPGAPEGAWQIGERLGYTKDLVLVEEATRLGWLSDRFLLPSWFPHQAAFSPGDVLIGAGAAWFSWSLGAFVTHTHHWQEAT